MAKIKNFILLLHKYTHVFFTVFGLAFIIFNDFITINIAYFFGALTFLLGFTYFAIYLLKMIKQKYALITLICSLLLIIVGIVNVIFAKSSFSLTLTVIFWIINGVIKVWIHLLFGIKQLKIGQKSGVYTLLMFVAILVMTILLIIHGASAIKSHVIFYGIETCLSSVVFLFGVQDGFTLWQLVDFEKMKTESN